MTVQTLDQESEVQRFTQNAVEFLDANQIVLKTPGGKTREEFTVDRSDSLVGQKKDWVVNFVLPEGYTRLSFAYSIRPSRSAGGSVRWNTDNSLDASIKVHGWADAFSKVTIIVENVLAIKG